MNAEIIAIGTELLLGEITDTNSAHLARAMRDMGLDLWWITVVGDNESRIAEAIRRACERSNIVITTGGLGPTVDDPTRAAVARAFGVPLEFRPTLWAQIEARFQRYGRAPTENNRKQAYVPEGAVEFENPVGTAPCFAVPYPGGVVISLPGVPREFEYMLEHTVEPYLRANFDLSSIIRARVLRTVGIGESLIDARIGDLEELSNPTVGLAAHPGQTDIRLTAKAATVAEADAMLDPLAADVRRRLGEFIYAEGKTEVEEVTARLLAAAGQTVAVAEAGTGSDVAKRLGRTPEAGQVLRATMAVDTPPDDIGALASAARETAGAAADWGLGVMVDLASDPPRLKVALAGASGVTQETFGFGGHPGLAVRWVGTAALNMLRLALMRKKS
ncbi:MAG: CinA family nicotinamide mononucleotide deamidase-related protein [Anaerolineales bacterium]